MNLIKLKIMIRQLSNIFNKKLKEKDKYYKKITNELIESNKAKDKQIEILCKTIKILNKQKVKEIIIERRIEIQTRMEINEKMEKNEQKETKPIKKTDKYTKPKNNFGQIQPILKTLDSRNIINRISQDSMRMSVNNMMKDEIIGFGFKNRFDYLYFKINLNMKSRIVLK